MTIDAFWAATPKEVDMAIEQRDKRDAWRAWLGAKLMRAKKLPSWKRLMGEPATKVLKGEELERRRAERDEMLRQIDLDKVNEAMRGK